MNGWKNLMIWDKNKEGNFNGFKYSPLFKTYISIGPQKHFDACTMKEKEENKSIEDVLLYSHQIVEMPDKNYFMHQKQRNEPQRWAKPPLEFLNYLSTYSINE